MRSADRLYLQKQIENEIIQLEPDFDDAANIIHAIHASMKKRYPAYMLWDLDHYFWVLDKALERAPLFAEPEEDEMALAKEEE